MEDTVKSIVGLIARWSLKFVGAWLVTAGISETAYLEVAAGVVSFVLGAIISLVMRKKDLATPPA